MNEKCCREQVKNFYPNLTEVISIYNEIQNKMMHCVYDTTDEEDEFLQNFCLYFAHALIKDTGFSKPARDELSKIAEIIRDVCF